jgi:hypothetical protein
MAGAIGLLLRHAAKSPAAPGQPGIFSLGGKGVLEQLMKGAGLVDVKTKILRASLRVSDASAGLEMMRQAFRTSFTSSSGPVLRKRKHAATRVAIRDYGLKLGHLVILVPLEAFGEDNERAKLGNRNSVGNRCGTWSSSRDHQCREQHRHIHRLAAKDAGRCRPLRCKSCVARTV